VRKKRRNWFYTSQIRGNKLKYPRKQRRPRRKEGKNTPVRESGKNRHRSTPTEKGGGQVLKRKTDTEVKLVKKKNEEETPPKKKAQQNNGAGPKTGTETKKKKREGERGSPEGQTYRGIFCVQYLKRGVRFRV